MGFFSVPLLINMVRYRQKSIRYPSIRYPSIGFGLQILLEHLLGGIETAVLYAGITIYGLDCDLLVCR